MSRPRMCRGAVRPMSMPTPSRTRRHPPQASMLDPFTPYLANAGKRLPRRDAAMEEIREQGYSGAQVVFCRGETEEREPAPTTPAGRDRCGGRPEEFEEVAAKGVSPAVLPRLRG